MVTIYELCWRKALEIRAHVVYVFVGTNKKYRLICALVWAVCYETQEVLTQAYAVGISLLSISYRNPFG